MENNHATSETAQEAMVITAHELLEHWQGHRRLTRKMIEVFPDDKLFTYSVGGMRPFAELIKEILIMGAPGIKGVVEGTWPKYDDVQKSFKNISSKTDLLRAWDQATDEINRLWPQIPQQRFHEVDKFFGQYEGPIYWSIFYVIDNEIHHRAQAYVYMRSLGIAPPPFWERN